jgi:predicted ATPase/DNA-binding SARP family transcriptional activator
MTPDGWRINLFGGLTARYGDRTLNRFEMRRAGVLLARLALYPHRQHPREELLELLWPDGDAEASRSRFRQVLTSLRHSLDSLGPSCADLLVADRVHVQLTPSLFSTDIGDFEAALRGVARAATREEQAEALKTAVTLYKGELLPGFYDDWALTERRRLADEAVSATARLANTLAEMGDREGAIEYARRAVAADSLREDTQGDLIRLYAATGQIYQALRQYQEVERSLWKELRALPSPELQALGESLRTQPVSGAAARSVPPVSPDALPTETPATTTITATASPEWETAALPVPLSLFFGRETEIERLTRLLTPTPAEGAPRLLSLVGPGGSGKTRLALEVARQFERTDAGAVWFVPLAAVTDPQRIIDAIAEVVCPLAHRTAPEAQVVEVLRRRPALLVLDNFEQLTEGGGPVVRTLLERTPGLRCLITTRRPLSIEGELEYAVPPLATPEAGDTVEQAKECPSVRLFLDRARMVRSDFALTPNNVVPVVTLCRRLEGVPLAIELAASWVGVLSPSEIVERLSGSLDVLVSSRTDVPERHRSLWATLEWSYRQLSPELQRFFARLSVFRNGWTLQAVEAVCRGDVSETDDDTGPAILALTQLRRHALVQAEDMGDSLRFRMLEPVRDYAGEQLSPDAARMLRQRHAHYFREMVRDAAPRLTGPDQIEWMDRLQAEHDNIRATLAWASSPEGDTELGLRLGASLWRFWEARGHHIEGLRWLTGLLAKADANDPMARAEALAACGNLGGIREEFAPSISFLQESLALFRRLDDPIQLGHALCSLGANVRDKGDSEAALPLFKEALEIFRTQNDTFGMARALGGMATMARAREDYPTAYSLLENSAALYRLCGHKKGMAWCIQTRGVFAFAEGNQTLAHSSLRESLPLFRALGDTMWVIYTTFGLAHVTGFNGQDALCREYLREGLAVARMAGTTIWEVRFLLWLGDTEYARQEPLAAQQWYREALALSERTDTVGGIEAALNRLAGIASSSGNSDRAVCLAAAAKSLNAMRKLDVPSGVRPLPPHFEDSDQHLRARLRGETMTRAEAVAYAMVDTP